MKKTVRGFTLIELLVVITIIALLSAIGFVSYSVVIKQGRDAKRQSDLRTIQSALEEYYRDQGYYPITGSPNGLDSALDDSLPSAFTSSTGNPSPPSPTKTYLKSLPQDPTDQTGAGRYRYEAYPTSPVCTNSSSNKCTSYCLYSNIDYLPGPGKPAACTNHTNHEFAVIPP